MDAQQFREAGFDAVIPGYVRYDDRLTANAKLLYGEIRALSTRHGYCFAGNDYFAELYRITERSARRIIAQLAEYGYLVVTMTRDSKGHPTGRRIYIGGGLALTDGDSEECHVIPQDKNVRSGQYCPANGQNCPPAQLNNNIYINNIYSSADKNKKSPDVETRKALEKWAFEMFGDAGAELSARLMDFCDMRLAKKKPLPVGRAVTILTNRLMRHSQGDLAIMLEMLDNSIISRWDSVFPLKGDELKRLPGGSQAAPQKEDNTPWV